MKQFEIMLRLWANSLIDETITDQALSMLDVDHEGLDYVIKIPEIYDWSYGGGPVGLRYLVSKYC